MMTLKSSKRVPLGQVVITQGALNDLPAEEVQESLLRHAEGDWGDLCKEEWEQNDEALENEARLMSSYRTKKGIRFWIITEWDRSVTTIFLPLEY
ncbi:MAG: hypothetical protein ACKV2Q_00935 [Planctomycetaceae bacterium]